MKLVWILLGVLLLLFLFFTEELYRYVFCRGSSRLFIRLFDSKGHGPGYYAFRDAGQETVRRAPAEVFTLPSARGETLKGFYYSNGSGGKKIAFICHGYRSEHTETGGLVWDCYRQRGIDLFVPDHTASGESQGHFIGFDVLETEDCLGWLDFLVQKFGSDTQILLHGFSMGAATVMKMSSRCPSNVKFIIEDSGYPDAHASMAHQVGPMYTPLRLINRLVAGYDWNDSDVTASLDRSTLPILFVHGQDDKLVPYPCGPALYARYRGPKDCLFPAGTRHIETMYTSPQSYGEKIDHFLAAYFT